VGSAIWLVLHEAASRGPSALADILVQNGVKLFMHAYNTLFSGTGKLNAD